MLGTRHSLGWGSVLGALGARHSPVVLGTRRWCSALPEMVAYAGKVRSGAANAGKVRMWWVRVRCEWWGCAVRVRYETVACACGSGTKKNVEWWNEPRPLVSNKMNNKNLKVI